MHISVIGRIGVIIGIIFCIASVTILFTGILKNKPISQGTTEAVTRAVTNEQPCSETPQTYLAKARHYLAVNDKWENGYPDAATSALAWMEYYKICSEYQRVQSDHRITTDERP